MNINYSYFLTILFLGLLIYSLFPTKAFTVTFSKNDLLVADRSSNGIWKVNRSTGEKTTITNFAGGQMTAAPLGVTVDSKGYLYVAADPFGAGDLDNSSDGTNFVYKIDPSLANGSNIVKTFTGGNLDEPVYVRIDSNGQLVVLNYGYGTPAAKIVRIDPDTGTPAGGGQTLVTSAGNLSGPVGFIIDQNGDYLIADEAAYIVKVTPAGVQSIFASGGFFNESQHLAFDAAGDIIVADQLSTGNDGLGSGALFKVNYTTKAQTLISEDDSNEMLLAAPAGGVVLEPDNQNVLVGDFGNAKIFRVNLTTGAQTQIASGFGSPWDLFLYPYEVSLGSNVAYTEDIFTFTFTSVTDAGDLTVGASAISDDTWRNNIANLYLIDSNSKKSVTTSGLTTTGDITVEITFTPQGGIAASQHYPIKFSSGVYTALTFSSVVDIGGGSYKGTFTTSSFSDFAVGVNPEPATLLLLLSALLGILPLKKKLL